MVGYLQLRACFSKTLSKKNLVPTDKIFVAFSLCSSQNKLKTKGYEDQRQKSKNNIRVALCQKTAGKKHLTFQKWHNFEQVAKMAILQRLQQNKWSQMVYTGTEPKNTKNKQKLPFKTKQKNQVDLRLNLYLSSLDLFQVKFVHGRARKRPNNNENQKF